MDKIIGIAVKLFVEQRGNVIVLVAASLLMMIGFTAVVVDGGTLFLEKSKLQKALDAAVLGGAQLLTLSEADAVNVAQDIARANGIELSSASMTTTSDSIQATHTLTKSLTFAKVLGFGEAAVSALAKAQILPLVSGEGIVPVGVPIEEFAFGNSYKLNFEPGQGHSGNYGYLSVTGRGANELRKAIENGVPLSISDPDDPSTFVLTEPGVQWGPVRSAFESRISADSGKPHCQHWETADNICRRVVIVPLVESYAENKGRSTVKIIGFAAFWIQGFEGKALTGRFIQIIHSGEVGGGTNYGVYGVRLVQ